MLYAIVAVLSIILDQWVKYWTAGNLTYGGEARELIPGLVELINVHNDGAAFSFLSGANAGSLFIILAIVFAVLVVIGLITNFISGKLARWSAVMVAAGGIGNAIDRALYSYVQDMFHLEFLPDFPVFNVADIFITVFCLIFIICIIFGGKGETESEDDIDYYEEEFEDVPKVRGARSSRDRRDYYDDEEEERPSRRRNTSEEDYDRPSRNRRSDNDYEEEPSIRQRRAQRGSDYNDSQESVSGANRNSTDNRRSRSSSDFEEAFSPKQSSQSASRRQAQSNEVPSQRRKQSVEDPFKEWDKQNASAGYSRAASDSRYSEEFEQTYSAPVSSAPSKNTVSQSVPAKPAATPKKSSSDDFSLDDILSEFK